MVVKSRYSRNFRDNPNMTRESTYHKEVQIQKEIERNIAPKPKATTVVVQEPKVEECPCCKANCKCCEHKSGIVGNRCLCRCHAQ